MPSSTFTSEAVLKRTIGQQSSSDYVRDDFGRTHASSWQNADTGGAWTTGSATNITYSTNGSEGVRANSGATSTETRVSAGATGTGNREVVFKVKVTELGTFRHTINVRMRRLNGSEGDPGGDGYLYRFSLGGSSLVNTMGVNSTTTLSSTSITSYSTSDNGSTNYVWCKAQIEGISPTNIRLKMWNDGATEPGWQINTTHSGSAQNASATGAEQAVVLTLADANTTPDWYFDHVRATSIPNGADLTFTADAVIASKSFTANAVLKKSASGSFTTDAGTRTGRTSSFTADAVIPGNRSFTANATLLAQVFNDTFERTVDHGLGANWAFITWDASYSYAEDSAMTVNGSAAQASSVDNYPILNYYYDSYAGFHGPDAGDAYFDFWSPSPTGTEFNTRYAPSYGINLDPYSYYGIYVLRDRNIGTYVYQLLQFGSDTPTNLTLAADQWFRLHARWTTNRVYMRVWDPADPEPTTWDYDQPKMWTAVGGTNIAPNPFLDFYYIGDPSALDNFQIWSMVSPTPYYGSFMANAVFEKKSFTADADIVPRHFTANAVLRKTITKSGAPALMSFVGSNSASSWPNVASIAIQKPTGTASGDVIVIFAYSNEAASDVSMTVSGFNIRNSDLFPDHSLHRQFDKVAGGSEPSSYTVNISPATGVNVVIATVRGNGTTVLPIDAEGDNGAPYDELPFNPKTFATPGIALVSGVASSYSPGNITLDAPLTQVENRPDYYVQQGLGYEVIDNFNVTRLYSGRTDNPDTGSPWRATMTTHVGNANTGFTMDAVLRANSFPANAVLRAPRSRSFTVDCVIDDFYRHQHERGDTPHLYYEYDDEVQITSDIGPYPGTTTLRDILLGLVSRVRLLEGNAALFTGANWSADAIIKANLSASALADAVLRMVRSGSFTGDAYTSLLRTGSFTGDAINRRTMATSFTADAIERAIIAASFSGNAISKRSSTGSWTGDADLLRVIAGALAADAIARVEQLGSFTADAYTLTLGEVLGSFTADAVKQALITAAFTSNADFLRIKSAAFTSDGITQTTMAWSFSEDADLLATLSWAFASDSVAKRTQSVSQTADAVVARTQSGSFTGNAIAQRTASSSLSSDGVLRATRSSSFTADAQFAYGFTADAVFTTGSFTDARVIDPEVYGEPVYDDILIDPEVYGEQPT